MQLSDNNLVVKSFFWKFFERTGTYIVQFIIQIILARILLPEEYGVVAIATIFIALANVFIQSGFNTSLVQQKNINDVDYSSVLYLSLLVSFVLYLIIFFTSPMIADFYDNTLISPVLRVLSLTLFFGAFNSIQLAYISRNMQFKKNFFCSLVSIIISGVVGIVFAYLGYGIWALVVQQLLNIILLIIILLFVIDWKPKLLFSFDRVKILFSYGWKLLFSSLIDTLYNNIYDLIIGKKYTTVDLAYYNRGKQFPNIIVSNVNGSISSVLLPAMSKKQDNLEIIKNMTRKAITLSSFVIFPMMIGLVVIAEPLVSLILTDKWLSCVPFLQILCFSYALWPIHTANLQAINAIGRSDIFLKLEIIKKIMGIVILIITIPMGLYAMAFGQIITGILSSFINAFPNKKLLKYSFYEQIRDLMPILFTSCLMGIIVYFISYLPLNNLLIITLQCIIAIVVYIIFSYILKIDSLGYIIKLINKNRKK